MKRADPFYKSDKWLRKRKTILIRDEYMCQECLKRHHMEQATCVHHIFPRDQYISYQYENWNLISLCDSCHDSMHNRFTGELSKRGWELLRITAHLNNIMIKTDNETILVIGLRGSGKSTYCRKHLDDESLCYDMDAIASAFRLKQPHEEYFKPARKMANDFLKGFIAKAHDYARKVYIIRTAPTIKELQEIEPTEVVVCEGSFVYREMDDREAAIMRINEIKKYCEEVKLPLTLPEKNSIPPSTSLK